MKFCTLCFASETDGSWGGAVVGQFCTNCSANGAVVELPDWAVMNIRRNASWVGKRYYPCDEDQERAEERVDLLALVDQFPGRSAVLHTINGRDTWEVRQSRADGRVISTTVTGVSTGQEAMRRASGLRFVPQWRFDEAKGEG